MITPLKTIMAAAATLLIVSAPVSAAESALGFNGSAHVSVAAVVSQSAAASTFDDEIYRRSCDYFRKRAQWSMAHIWWGKYQRCLHVQSGS